MIRDISGRHNHSVKLARKLQSKKHRRERGLLVGEGLDLLQVALDHAVEVRDVLVRRDLVTVLPEMFLDRAAATDASRVEGPHVGVCDEDTLAYASALGGSADVIFSSPIPVWSLNDLELVSGLTLFLDGVGDPGNVGTLVRSCVAFGAAGIMCSPGTADPYSPKGLRAGMGAQFGVKVVTEVTPIDLRAKLDRLPGGEAALPPILVAQATGGEDVGGVRLENGAVVVLGAERHGPSDAWAGARRITIPQEAFDSLNVAMAGTVLLYELTRHCCRQESP